MEGKLGPHIWGTPASESSWGLGMVGGAEKVLDKKGAQATQKPKLEAVCMRNVGPDLVQLCVVLGGSLPLSGLIR